ncbi:cyclin domain-containing protein [Diplodia corticola]|uniref:Cyclin domain-containing protein n=1 Tax=Diplodia corticola TaxID=236234 RepID=A0A1J9SHB8_9PEZI|nr:cyclin domain-containing protein [Diplodia corticola]OJD39767.1 cyclin domain-containing protein [Diplodia corticola]
MSDMAPQHPSHLSNPLATPAQLAQSGSQLDGVPTDLEDSIRFAGQRLTQAAGILLRLPQDIVAQAIVVFTRFWIGSEGGSLKDYGAKDVSAAALYTVAKLSAYPRPPRAVINAYQYLDSLPATYVDPQKLHQEDLVDPEAYYVSEGTYHALRALLLKTEAHVLRVLGFDTHVALPYTLVINYLQALGVVFDDGDGDGTELARRAFALLNTALLSPQLVCCTHQPPQLATAAVYLAARDVGVKLPGEPWWEVFDTDREELGFLVVAMVSMPGFAAEEKAKWGTRRRVPLTLEELDAELERRRMLEEGQ